jgi:hypothetical protein
LAQSELPSRLLDLAEFASRPFLSHFASYLYCVATEINTFSRVITVLEPIESLSPTLEDSSNTVPAEYFIGESTLAMPGGAAMDVDASTKRKADPTNMPVPDDAPSVIVSHTPMIDLSQFEMLIRKGNEDLRSSLASDIDAQIQPIKDQLCKTNDDVARLSSRIESLEAKASFSQLAASTAASSKGPADTFAPAFLELRVCKWTEKEEKGADEAEQNLLIEAIKAATPARYAEKVTFPLSCGLKTHVLTFFIHKDCVREVLSIWRPLTERTVTLAGRKLFFVLEKSPERQQTERVFGKALRFVRAKMAQDVEVISRWWPDYDIYVVIPQRLPSKPKTIKAATFDGKDIVWTSELLTYLSLDYDSVDLDYRLRRY